MVVEPAHQPVRRDHRQHVRRRDDQRHQLADAEQGPGQGRHDRPHLPRGRLRRERRGGQQGGRQGVRPGARRAQDQADRRRPHRSGHRAARRGGRLRPADHDTPADGLRGRCRRGVRVRCHLPRLQPLLQPRPAPQPGQGRARAAAARDHFDRAVLVHRARPVAGPQGLPGEVPGPAEDHVRDVRLRPGRDHGGHPGCGLQEQGADERLACSRRSRASRTSRPTGWCRH